MKREIDMHYFVDLLPAIFTGLSGSVVAMMISWDTLSLKIIITKVILGVIAAIYVAPQGCEFFESWNCSFITLMTAALALPLFSFVFGVFGYLNKHRDKLVSDYLKKKMK